MARLLRSEPIDRALVFTRTKHGADKVVRGLAKAGIAAHAIHGNKSQNQRERVLGAFRAGTIRTLVATDIAARGIDVDGVSHVVNFDLPNEPETYVHRIGRTARAGAAGIAISLVGRDEAPYLRAIEKLIRLSIPPHKGAAAAPSAQPHPSPAKAAPRRHRNHGGGHPGSQTGGPARSDRPQSGRTSEPTRAHHRPHRRTGGAQGVPTYGERPHHQGGQQSGPAGQDPSGIAGVGFMRRPVPARRDDAGRSPR